MFSKEDIDELLRLHEIGENSTDSDDISGASVNSLALRMVEAKMFVDRWNQCVSDYIFNSSMKDFIITSLKGKINVGGNQIWGANIHYSDFCPVDVGIAVDTGADPDYIKIGRHVAVFPV